MKCETLRPMTRPEVRAVRNTRRTVIVTVPAGTVIEHPQAFLLVQRGIAKPLDEECHFAAGLMTEDQIAKAAERYSEVDAGIHPEDLALFRSGKITGYRAEYDPNNEPPSKQYLPGPNWTNADAEEIDGGGEYDDEDEEPPEGGTTNEVNQRQAEA